MQTRRGRLFDRRRERRPISQAHRQHEVEVERHAQQRARLQDAIGLMCAGEVGRAVRAQHEQRPLVRSPRELFEQQQTGRIGPVQVVEYEQQPGSADALNRQQQLADSVQEAKAVGRVRRRHQFRQPLEEFGK